jgi:hypothetical protein
VEYVLRKDLLLGGSIHMGNIVEQFREEAVSSLFRASGFSAFWRTWKPGINSLFGNRGATQVLGLGDQLSSVFFLTNAHAGRTQSVVSGGGSAWESLVCWYLNLCLIGRRTVVIKHSKDLIPSPIADAITVNYQNFTSNTESDLIAITFPDLTEYSVEKNLISIRDSSGSLVPTTRGTKFNRKGIVDALVNRDFTSMEVNIIQCKTNWNDNAQIPMLWDMIYSARVFRNPYITIGKNGFSIDNIRRFTYSFITVPTVQWTKIKANSTCVKRVSYLSGGNYWGRPSSTGIASSIKEILNRNLSSGSTQGHLTTLASELPLLQTNYGYFQL